MKKLLLVSLMFLMFAGVVSASSINGEYNGNPIVKLKSNGSLIDTGEVPAMIYDGKTMVPIAALRNLGADVVWDANTYSVDVNMPKFNTPEASQSLIKYTEAKINARVAMMYKRNQDLASRLMSYNNTLSLYFNGHSIKNPTAYTDDQLDKFLSDIISNYNDVSNEYNQLIKDLPGLDTSDLFAGIDLNYKSIDSLKLATTNIINWNYYTSSNDYYNSQKHFDLYLSNNSDGFNKANDSWLKSSTGHSKHMFKIING